MSDLELTLDPRAEELLQEIAADPDACLLRAPRGKFRPSLFASDKAESFTLTGATSAERELVRAHRAEVAYWLRVQCVRQLGSAPQFANHITNRLGATAVVQLPKVAPPVAAMRAESNRRAHAADGTAEALRLLRADSDLNATAGDILVSALTSHRLVPCASARRSAVLALGLDTQYRAARQMCAREIATQSDREHVARAWANDGWTLARTKRFDEASEAYWQAWCIAPQNPMSALERLRCCAQTSDVARVRRWLQAIARVEPPANVVKEWAEMANNACASVHVVVQHPNYRAYGELGALAQRLLNGLH